MAVEIREVIIRSIIDQESKQKREAAGPEEKEEALDKATVVTECVNQVMRILKKKQYR